MFASGSLRPAGRFRPGRRGRRVGLRWSGALVPSAGPLAVGSAARPPSAQRPPGFSGSLRGGSGAWCERASWRLGVGSPGRRPVGRFVAPKPRQRSAEEEARVSRGHSLLQAGPARPLRVLVPRGRRSVSPSDQYFDLPPPSLQSSLFRSSSETSVKCTYRPRACASGDRGPPSAILVRLMVLIFRSSRAGRYWR